MRLSHTVPVTRTGRLTHSGLKLPMRSPASMRSRRRGAEPMRKILRPPCLQMWVQIPSMRT